MNALLQESPIITYQWIRGMKMGKVGLC